MKDEYGAIESLPAYLQTEYTYAINKATGKVETDDEGKKIWEVNRNFDTSRGGRARRVLDRRITMLAKEMNSAISGTAEGRSDAEILNEILGRGNDVKDFELVQALLSGDFAKVAQKVKDKEWDHRIIEKAERFLGAGFKIAQNWDQGRVMRDALYSEVLPPEIIERAIAELNRTGVFEKTPAMKSHAMRWINEMQDNDGHVQKETMYEIRTMMRRTDSRQLVNQMIRTVMKLITPTVKSF